ncbi:MAG: lipo-like protein [Thiomonas sp.]
MNRILAATGNALARYLTAPSHCARITAPTDLDAVRAAIRPADVLLVEGNTRLSSAIKYLTHSNWSHAALCVGEDAGCFIEADVVEGVHTVGWDAFVGMGLRICRPLALRPQDAQRVIDAARARIGHTYDLRNIFDLARYLLPTPPVPGRVRRRMLSLGSGDPTRAICSGMIAQCFQGVRYPILPEIEQRADDPNCAACLREQWAVRHHSLFVPADFDRSPYFAIIKPEASAALDYAALPW